MWLFPNLRGPSLLAALAILLTAACDRSPDKSPPPPPHPPAASASASAAPAPPEVPSAAPTASAAAPPSAGGEVAGTWQGTYDAKKGTVGVPPTVKDKGRASDDGKAMSGPGKVEIVISPDGFVKGKSSGALGDATLTGKMNEGDNLGLTWMPDDPTTPNAMTGVLVGPLKDGVIHGEIRVAGPDATIVRKALIDLKRSK